MRTVAVALVLAVGLSACGGDDGGAAEADPSPEEVATDPTALSPEQWTFEASELCEAWVDGTVELDPAAVAELTMSFGEGLDALAEPIDITEQARALVDAVQQLGSALEAGEPVDEAIASVAAAADDLEAAGLECEVPGELAAVVGGG